MEEIWKPVVGYEGLYEVSNTGHIDQCERVTKIKGGTTQKDRVRVKTHIDIYGYERLALTKDKKQKIIGVHRIVAKSFIENLENHPMVNHRDENKLNNTVENLEWCNNRYNIMHGTARQRRVVTYKRNLELRKNIVF